MKGDSEAQVLNCCDLTYDEMKALAYGTDKDRSNASVSVSKLSKEKVLTPAPLTLFEEICCLLFLSFTVPLGAFTIPGVLYLLGRYVIGNVQYTYLGFFVAILPLAILPQPFVPSMQQSWMANLIVKYFSYRFIFEELPPTKNLDDPNYHPRILVAP